MRPVEDICSDGSKLWRCGHDKKVYLWDCTKRVFDSMLPGQGKHPLTKVLYVKHAAHFQIWACDAQFIWVWSSKQNIKNKQDMYFLK